MIDTHCHLNFKSFADRVEEVVKKAKEAGVERFIVPGTDVETSKKAIELAQKYDFVYAAVGIHPHHAKQYQISDIKYQIEDLLKNKKVVAVGEIGLDKHYYQKTKYENYQIDPEFIKAQKQLFISQIKLAIKYKKSLIIHNREATGETLEIVGESSILTPLAGHMVFHCCEAKNELLNFALAHQIYIGVDGDVTYANNRSKEEFVKKIPLDLLVLETDAPFLLPEPLRSQNKDRAYEKRELNEPKNLRLIAQKIALIKKISVEKLMETTQKNSQKLFNIG